MSDHLDLKRYLEEWTYDPEKNAKFVKGDDGREILQVRLPLGIEQYELEGRPDGKRPHGHESLLLHHIERLAAAKIDHKEKEFSLHSADCAELFSEAMLFYYRYLHLFQLKDWRRTIRDTERNLQLFDFVRQHASRERDQSYLEQWRPYVFRMNTIARAMQELDGGRTTSAIHIVRAGIEAIENLAEIDSETFLFERKRSVTALRELAEQIEGMKPVCEVERLEQELRESIAAEEFEKAAALRDRIRQLRADQKP